MKVITLNDRIIKYCKMSNQVGARMKCFPLNGSLPFVGMVGEMWSFLNLMRERTKDGFDFGDWEVRYFDWLYSEDGLVVPVPGDKGVVAIAPLVLVQRGNILWREWRLLESQVEGGFINIRDFDTAHGLKGENVCLSRFVAIMIAIQGFRVRFRGTAGLDGQTIQYEYLNIGQLFTKVTFHKARWERPTVFVRHVVKMRVCDVFDKLEEKLKVRRGWVEGQMTDYGLVVGVIHGDAEMDKKRRGYERELNDIDRTWLRWPVETMLSIPSHLMKNYFNEQYCFAGMNGGAGPSSWSLREE